MKSDDSTFGYVSVNALMEFARNHVDRKVDCNDIARFPRSNVRNADEQQSLQQIFGIPFDRLRELADAEREGRIRIGSDWTPCAEGLPVPHHKGQQREMFLVSLETGCVSTMFYEFNPNGYLGEGWSDKILTVIAWQPLPEPYNPDRKED